MSQRLPDQDSTIFGLQPGPDSYFLIVRNASSPSSFLVFSDDFQLTLPHHDADEAPSEVLFGTFHPCFFSPPFCVEEQTI